MPQIVVIVPVVCACASAPAPDVDRVADTLSSASAPSSHLPRIDAPPRPLVDDVNALDYFALPIMTEEPIEKEHVVSFLPVDASACPGGEVPGPPVTWFTNTTDMPTILSIGGRPLPKVKPFRHDDSEVFWFMGSLSREDFTSVALDLGTVTERSAVITRLEGRYEPNTHRAVATRRFRVVATSLMRGEVYAFRRCGDGSRPGAGRCSGGAGPGESGETLEIVGPPSIWVGSSGDTSSQHLEPRSSLSDLATEIAPGASATLSLLLSSESLAAFHARDVGADTPTVVSVSVDVVWPVGQDPVIHVFTATAQKGPVSLRPGRPVYTGPFPACVSLDTSER
jgi:hypothetical protein